MGAVLLVLVIFAVSFPTIYGIALHGLTPNDAKLERKTLARAGA